MSFLTRRVSSYAHRAVYAQEKHLLILCSRYSSVISFTTKFNKHSIVCKRRNMCIVYCVGINLFLVSSYHTERIILISKNWHIVKCISIPISTLSTWTNIARINPLIWHISRIVHQIRLQHNKMYCNMFRYSIILLLLLLFVFWAIIIIVSWQWFLFMRYNVWDEQTRYIVRS